MVATYIVAIEQVSRRGRVLANAGVPVVGALGAQTVIEAALAGFSAMEQQGRRLADEVRWAVWGVNEAAPRVTGVWTPGQPTMIAPVLYGEGGL
jgi:hypothetical protein